MHKKTCKIIKIFVQNSDIDFLTFVYLAQKILDFLRNFVYIAQKFPLCRLHKNFRGLDKGGRVWYNFRVVLKRADPYTPFRD